MAKVSSEDAREIVPVEMYGSRWRPTVEAEDPDWLVLARDVVNRPSREQRPIMRQILHAKALGLDIKNPALIQHCVDAGLRELALMPKPEPSIPPRLQLAPELPDFGCVTNPPHASVVYYMILGTSVKIGISTNIRSRFDALCAEALFAVEAGGRDVERTRHLQFARSHTHLEWFALTEHLIDHMWAVRRQFEEQTGTTLEKWFGGPLVRHKAVPLALGYEQLRELVQRKLESEAAEPRRRRSRAVPVGSDQPSLFDLA